MIARNIETRISRLEETRQPFQDANIAKMDRETLRALVARTIDELGGRDAALTALHAADFDADTIKMVEDWPTWPLTDQRDNCGND